MPVLPHDVADLRLAPVALTIEAQIEELSALSLQELHVHVGLVSDRPDTSSQFAPPACWRRCVTPLTVTTGNSPGTRAVFNSAMAHIVSSSECP
ncbi:MAG TPA: hypothetical protein VGF76_20155 [Polyangiaceae bacterium]